MSFTLTTEPSRSGRGSGCCPCSHLASPISQGLLWHYLVISGSFLCPGIAKPQASLALQGTLMP